MRQVWYRPWRRFRRGCRWVSNDVRHQRLPTSAKAIGDILGQFPELRIVVADSTSHAPQKQLGGDEEIALVARPYDSGSTLTVLQSDVAASVVYANPICSQLDQLILRSLMFDDVLKLQVSHRGVFFVQNLVTSLQLLASLRVSTRSSFGIAAAIEC